MRWNWSMVKLGDNRRGAGLDVRHHFRRMRPGECRAARGLPLIAYRRRKFPQIHCVLHLHRIERRRQRLRDHCVALGRHVDVHVAEIDARIARHQNCERRLGYEPERVKLAVTLIQVNRVAAARHNLIESARELLVLIRLKALRAKLRVARVAEVLVIAE
jgi:hypothetical protein